MPSRHDDRVWFAARRHGVVLVGPLLRAFLLAGIGVALLVGGAVAVVVGAVALALAALVALGAVWRWERTRLVVTAERIALARGTVRRRTASVPLRSVGVVELEQTVLGKLLGYGTLVVGPLAIDHVARPREVCRLITRLAA